MHQPTFLIIDLFCGFGGTTTGFIEAQIDGNKLAKVVACVNHDPKAIKSHWLNYPEVTHYEEDIRTLDLSGLVETLNHWKNMYPNAYTILWASLECTNFSKAKGGQARDADSRILAEHLFRYQQALNPDYIQIENVVEFMSWGPLDENGKPLSRKNGCDWVKWRNEMCSYGYYDEWKELNSADFGAYTSRNRLFGCFAKEGLPIVWPTPTHSKKANLSMYGNLKKWKAVKDVLDFDNEGKSIFNRKKPLSDKTLERIYAGLLKYVANGDSSFISKYFSGRPAGKVIPTDGPAGTITTADGQSLVQAKFLQHYYGNGFTTGMEDPCPTLTTKERCALVQATYFIDRDFKSITNSSIEDPAGTITTVPKMNLVEVTPFIMPTNFNNKPTSIDDPLQTITANRKHHYIVNPSHGGHCTSTDAPCPVIIARQDKAPLYLIQAEKGTVAVPVFDCDSEIMIQIKRFMEAFGLVDIKMRMLMIHELLKIQGFPSDYQMVGNQSDHKKFIGNSVHPLVPKVWAEVMALRLSELNEKVA